jgi:hypothetical protein
MTLPTSPVNNQGPWYETDVPVNELPAPAPGSQQSVANSPQGGSETANDFTGGFNYTNSITSTTEFLEDVLQVQSEQEGTPALTSAPVIAGTPSVQWNDWNTGVVGTVGNKFS